MHKLQKELAGFKETNLLCSLVEIFILELFFKFVIVCF